MTNSNARDLFPGALEMMILESLRRQPAHGYALVQHIQQRSNNQLQVEEGSLYPALQRLLKARLVNRDFSHGSVLCGAMGLGRDEVPFNGLESAPRWLRRRHRRAPRGSRPDFEHSSAKPIAG